MFSAGFPKYEKVIFLISYLIFIICAPFCRDCLFIFIPKCFDFRPDLSFKCLNIMFWGTRNPIQYIFREFKIHTIQNTQEHLSSSQNPKWRTKWRPFPRTLHLLHIDVQKRAKLFAAKCNASATTSIWFSPTCYHVQPRQFLVHQQCLSLQV